MIVIIENITTTGIMRLIGLRMRSCVSFTGSLKQENQALSYRDAISS